MKGDFRMKCDYMDRRHGCKHGCIRTWIKCHSFFDGRGCEYSEEARCHRGWHYHSFEEYEQSQKKRLRQVTISSEDSDEEPCAKKPRKETAETKQPSRPFPISGLRAEESSSSTRPPITKASPAAVDKAMWHMHIVNLGLDITAIESKTCEDIQESYERTYARLTNEGASLEKIMCITTSFHEVMKKKTIAARAVHEGGGD